MLYGILIAIALLIAIGILLYRKLVRMAIACAVIGAVVLGIFLFFSPQSPLPLGSKIPSTNDMATILATYATTTALTPKSQGKIFCNVHPFVSEPESEQRIYLYAWLSCKEFYKNGTSLAEGQTLSNAGKFTFEQRNPKEWLVAKVTFAKTGVLFEKSVEDLFPKEIVTTVTQDKTIREALDKKVRDQALTYFNIAEK